jgi:hypothetical protein
MDGTGDQARLTKKNMTCFLSYVESKSKNIKYMCIHMCAWHKHKRGTIWGEPVGEEGGKESMMGGEYYWCTLYTCTKPINNCIKNGGEGKVIEGVNFIKIHYMYVWKYRNETSLYKLYIVIKKRISENGFN